MKQHTGSSTRTTGRRRVRVAVLASLVGVMACAQFTARDDSWGIGNWPALASIAEGTQERQNNASAGCVTCHDIEHKNMHPSNRVRIGCADCHGGDPTTTDIERAHVHPAFPGEWSGSRNPENTYALLNREKTEYIRFINPGDLRVAADTCGGCHPDEVSKVSTSIMAHSAMVPGSGLYNNGVTPFKNYKVGEFYMRNGQSGMAKMDPPPTEEELAAGVVPSLIPAPRYNISQPGNIFRFAERGQPAQRGLGTGGRVDFAHFVVTKTRLNDPYLWFLGTNDYAGEFRSSGCSACHVAYANTDDPKSAHRFADKGFAGHSFSKDETIPKNEPGHPIEHVFTKAIPSSQCLTCHNHQGSGAVANYAGIMWWDGETDGEQFYNEDGSLVQGDALHTAHLEANKTSKHTKFAPMHRSGWSFRKVYKRNLQGQLIGRDGNLVDWNDPDWESKAVHLADHHFEAGMHCIDCHTEQDVHGDGRLYGAMIDPVEIYCTDCHGTIQERTDLTTSNKPWTNDLSQATAADGGRQFTWVEEDGRQVLYQRSKLDSNLRWKVPQLADVVDPDSPIYNKKAAIAKTLEKGTHEWGDTNVATENCAHSEERMTCYTCHTSWAVSCSGCHLSGKTNRRREFLHFWGEKTQVDVGYYSQGLRSDCLMLGINGTTKGNKISPIRSASAPIASAENANRAMVLHQQPTVAASGHSGHAFSPYIPHTVSSTHGQKCSSCHIDEADSNNAILATRFNLGVHATDFVGAFAHLATSDGVAAVRVTQGWEPQPVIGSDFHEMTLPDDFRAHVDNDLVLTEAHTHGSSRAKSIQARGEYLYIADGPGGLRVFDIANIANKDVAQRIVSAPFSPLGHHAHVASADATAVLLPSTTPMDPLRVQDPANQEQPVHPLFGYAYVTDSAEGLIVVEVNTFVDGDPDNNFIERAATFNPGGALAGAVGGKVVGNYVYVLTSRGLAIVNIENPTAPRLVKEVAGLQQPRAIDVQFRYAAVTDAQGMKVLDITDLESPTLVGGATVPLADARGLRLCRTYAYVAAGREGIAIIDVQRFLQPKLVSMFTADGAINDATAVTTGLTNASLFAYVADGRNGLRVIELWTPSRSHGTYGFSPVPTPRLIASYPTGAPATAISTGMERDRGVDESGNQVGVYGRLGARPLNKQEREGFYLSNGEIYRVNDEASGYQEK